MRLDLIARVCLAAKLLRAITLAPIGFAAGDAWLAKHQEDRLCAWVEANLAVLLAYWDGDILYDQDLRLKLVPLGGSRGDNDRANEP